MADLKPAKALEWQNNAHFPLVIMGIFFGLFMHAPHISSRSGVGIDLTFNLASWIPVSFLIGLSLLRIGQTNTLKYSDLSLLLGACCAMLFIPLLNPASTSFWDNLELWGVMAGLVLLLALQQWRFTEREMDYLLLLVLAGASLQAIHAWWDYLGLSFQAFSLIQGEGRRPLGVFGQPNVMASFLATGLALSAFLLGRFRDGPRHWRGAWLLLYPLFSLSLLVVLSSRTGWIASLGVLILLLPWLRSRLDRGLLWYWLASCLLGLVLGLVCIWATGASQNVLRKLSVDAARTTIYPQVTRLALEKPLVGWGYGQFEGSYNLRTAEWYAAGEADTAGFHNLSHPHNELLYRWVEGGIVALAALLMAAFLVLRAIFRCQDRFLRLALLGLLFPVILHSQTEMPFLSSVPHWVVFIILLFVVDGYAGQAKQVASPLEFAPKVFGLLIPLITTLFMVSAIHTGAVLARFERTFEADVSSLEGLINPAIWMDRLYWNLNYGMLATAVVEQRPDLALPYIEWANATIEQRPRAGYMSLLVIAYKVLGDMEAAEAAEKQARFRYPHYDFNFEVRGPEQFAELFPPQARPMIIDDETP